MLFQFLVEEHGVNQRQQCKMLSAPRRTFQYPATPKNEMPVIQALKELVAKYLVISF
jgi:hypothetical protein